MSLTHSHLLNSAQIIQHTITIGHYSKSFSERDLLLLEIKRDLFLSAATGRPCPSSIASEYELTKLIPLQRKVS